MGCRCHVGAVLTAVHKCREGDELVFVQGVEDVGIAWIVKAIEAGGTSIHGGLQERSPWLENGLGLCTRAKSQLGGQRPTRRQPNAIALAGDPRSLIIS